MVVVSTEAGAPTVRARLAAEKSELMRGVRSDPLVQAVLARFPGSEVVDVRRQLPDGGPGSIEPLEAGADDGQPHDADDDY
jgi:DNA polymerase-3 subunit gamma/tau